MPDLEVLVGSYELAASWTDTNPDTKDALAEALPLEGDVTRWGDELYFQTDVDVPGENTRTEVPVGGIAYWPQGNALCLFWGSAPASHDDEARAAGPVNVIGQMFHPLRGRPAHHLSAAACSHAPVSHPPHRRW